MKKTVIFIFVLASVFGCRDLFEKDISEKKVQVVSPVDKAVATQGETMFLWQEVESATEYRFTLVSPSFAASSKVIADTVFRQDSIPFKHRLTIPLDAGEYQWRITARNAAYTTRENILTLYVEAVEPEDDNGDED